jgi:hypothetical protein
MQLNDPNHFAASDVKSSKASVADYLAFEALPEETKNLIQRLYGDHLTPVGEHYTEEDLREAYEAGWDDCAEAFERPWIGGEADRYIRTVKKSKAR